MEMPGDKRLGAVSYQFEGTDCHAEIAGVPGLAENWPAGR